MKLIIQSFFAITFILYISTAQANDPFALRVSKAGDLTLSCEELIEEALLMRDIMQTTSDIKTEQDLDGHAITAAGTVGSFIVGGLTGGIGLAAAGLFASNQIDNNKESIDDIQDIAEQRRALLLGIHQSKDCDQDSITAALTPITEKESLALGVEKIQQLNTPPKAAPYTDPYNE